jgi:hypothetical protein
VLALDFGPPAFDFAPRKPVKPCVFAFLAQVGRAANLSRHISAACKFHFF